MLNKQLNNMEQMALHRAERSIRCLPFKRAFYEMLDHSSINAEELCMNKNCEEFVFAPFGAQRAEEHFIWMIKLGILRREVDGQGLTSRVRLTPMGRELVATWSGEVNRAGLRERILETLRRHRFRL